MTMLGDKIRSMLLTAQYRRRGIEAVNSQLLRPGRGVDLLLARYGATVAAGGVVYGPMTIHNADPDYRNLTLGRHVHIGRNVLLDLTDALIIDDEATISMGCTLLTHQDIGSRPLSTSYPRETARTVIGAGAYLGANVTVLAGANVGQRTVVGAGSVVIQELPSCVVAVGSPARPIRTIEQPGR